MQTPLRILLVEDSPDDAEVLVRELRRTGFAFTWERVQTEPEFLAALDRAPDVILADMMLPSFSGLRALQLVQTLALEVPVILVSGQAGDELAVSALQQGAADYLLKDRLGRLGLAVGNALRRTQLNAQKLAAERALAEREKRYRALIDNSPDGIGLLDAELRLVYASPAFARLLGYTPADYLALGPLALIHPDDAAALQAAVSRLLADPTFISVDAFRFKHHDGTWRWLEGTAQNLLAEPGVEGLVVSYRDITEPRRVEEALRASDARNRILANLTADFALELRLNPAGRLGIEWLTDSFTTLTGYTLAEVQTLGWRMLLHPADLALAETFVRELAAGRNGRAEVRLVTRAGALRWVRLYAQAVDAAPGVLRIYLAAQDITERQASEAALRQQAEEFAALYETARDVAVAHDLPALLETLVGRAVALLHAPVAGVYLYDPEHGDLAVTVSHGYPVPPGVRLRVGEGLAGHVAQSRQPLAVPDYQQWAGRAAAYANVPFAAVLGVPMLYQGELVGVVVVDELTPSPRQFSQADERLLTLFAGLAAGAVRTSRLLAAQRQRLQEQQAINRLSTVLRAAQTLDDMLPLLLDETLAVVAAADGAVGLLNAGVLELRVQRGFFANLGDGAQSERGIGEVVVASGRPYVSRDFAADPVTRPSVRPHLQTGWGGVVVPILGGAVIIGVLYVAVPLPREILPSEVRLLTTVAEMAGSALQRMQVLVQAQERAEQLAAVNALGRALAETLDLPPIYAQLCATTRRLLPELGTLALYLLDPEQRQLECVYADRAGQALAVTDRPPLALAAPNTAPARVVTDRQPLIETGRAAPAAPTALYVPLLAKGAAIGLMLVESARDGRFAVADAELLAGVANTAAVAIDNARLFAETEQRLQYFEALHHIDMAISGSLDLNVTLMVLLDQLRAKLRVDAAAVLLYHPGPRTFELAVGRGFRTRQIEQARVRLGEGPTGEAVLERRALHLGQLAALPAPRPRAAVVDAEGFQAYFALPLFAKGQLKGLLELFHRAPLAPEVEWLNFLDALASQAAIAVDNATLFDHLQRSNVELIQAYDATIEGWGHLLDQRDHLGLDHTRRLADRAVALARALGEPEEQLGHLRRGALLHDVGLLGLSDGLLGKPGPLDPAERAEIERHPQLAQELLSPIAFLRPALDIPYAHHERWDGSGYPRGLTGEAIPRAARIFAVVDVWDALTSPRPWRTAWTDEAARAHLRAKAGVEFDPEVVAAFLNLPAE